MYNPASRKILCLVPFYLPSIARISDENIFSQAEIVAEINAVAESDG